MDLFSVKNLKQYVKNIFEKYKENVARFKLDDLLFSSSIKNDAEK